MRKKKKGLQPTADSNESLTSTCRKSCSLIHTNPTHVASIDSRSNQMLRTQPPSTRTTCMREAVALAECQPQALEMATIPLLTTIPCVKCVVDGRLREPTDTRRPLRLQSSAGVARRIGLTATSSVCWLLALHVFIFGHQVQTHRQPVCELSFESTLSVRVPKR